MSFDPGAGGISGASDVFLSNPASNDALSYNNGVAKWVNAPVDKARVGLTNVDNTSDANKPVSTAMQTALNAKADSSTVATALAGKADSVHTHAISDTANLQTTLDAKANTASLATVATSGNYNDLSNKPTIPVTSVNTQTGAVVLTKSDVGLGNVDNTSDANKPISTATQTALNGKSDTNHTHAGYLATKNNIVALTNSTNDQFVRVDITDDASATAGWPDRHAYYFSGVRTGYHNEYGELRARPAKSNTVAFRAMKWASSSSVDILQVTDSNAATTYFAVGPTSATVNVPISSTGNITTTGQVTASNIGNKVTASTTAPSSPVVGDVWIDLSS